jgi:hypothetical protein
MGFSELHVTIEPERDRASGRLVCTFQNDVGDASHAPDARFPAGFVAEGRYLLEATEHVRVATSVLIPRARG